MIMPNQFRNEQELYNLVKNNYNELASRHPERFSDGKERFVTKEYGLGDRMFYLIGEVHGSFRPVRYVHSNTVPLIEKNPKSWLFFSEAAKFKSENEYLQPSSYYFKKLPEIFNMAVVDAIENLREPEIKKYIMAHAGIIEDELDISHLSLIMSHPSAKRVSREQVVQWASECLGRPTQDVLRLMKTALDGNVLDFEEVVGKSWDSYVKKRFHEILDTYPEKKNVLVLCGALHLPAFE